MEIRTPYLGVNNLSSSVIKSFLSYTQKNPEKSNKNPKNPQKIQGLFLRILESLHLIWEWATPRFQCLKKFFSKIKIRKKIRKKSKKSEKSKRSEKSKEFCYDLKSTHPIWEWKTSRAFDSKNVNWLIVFACGQPSGFMENSVPYSSIKDINLMVGWDGGHRHCLRIVVADGSILLQVRTIPQMATSASVAPVRRLKINQVICRPRPCSKINVLEKGPRVRVLSLRPIRSFQCWPESSDLPFQPGGRRPMK